MCLRDYGEFDICQLLTVARIGRPGQNDVDFSATYLGVKKTVVNDEAHNIGALLAM